MKAVILAGGLGTRLSEETGVRPKPMVEIGGRPIIWHIMRMYEAAGITDFIVCCGFKGTFIKEWFLDYSRTSSDFSIDLVTGSVTKLAGNPRERRCDPWNVTLIDTGLNTMTGGRIKRALPYVDGTFCCTYGDGVSDLDIAATVAFHKEHGQMATMTAVKPPGRFGAFQLHDRETQVESFREKPDGDGSWINGGFFVMEPSVGDFIAGDDTVWEREPLESLAATGNLHAYRHPGFWQPMDTLRDKLVLDQMWKDGKAPWRVWNE